LKHILNQSQTNRFYLCRNPTKTKKRNKDAHYIKKGNQIKSACGRPNNSPLPHSPVPEYQQKSCATLILFVNIYREYSQIIFKRKEKKNHAIKASPYGRW